MPIACVLPSHHHFQLAESDAVYLVVPAENSCESDSLFESGALNGGSYTWKANVPAGTQAMFVVDGDSGNEAWSGAVSPLDTLRIR